MWCFCIFIHINIVESIFQILVCRENAKPYNYIVGMEFLITKLQSEEKVNFLTTLTLGVYLTLKLTLTV